MQKKILVISSAIGILALLIAGAYYIAIYLPQKQKASIEIVKLELEAKIEQEKTEQLKIEQQKAEEDSKKEADLLAAEKEKEEIERKKNEEMIQKNSSVSSIKKSCNDSALAKARARYKEVNPDYDNPNKYYIDEYEGYYNRCLREKGL